MHLLLLPSYSAPNRRPRIIKLGQHLGRGILAKPWKQTLTPKGQKIPWSMVRSRSVKMCFLHRYGGNGGGYESAVVEARAGSYVIRHTCSAISLPFTLANPRVHYGTRLRLRLGLAVPLGVGAHCSHNTVVCGGPRLPHMHAAMCGRG